jgi:VanZ family protein
MPRIPKNPNFWLGCFLFWLIALWTLSSFSLGTEVQPPVNHFDKVMHFGYFFGGSGLLSAFLFYRRPQSPNWKWIVGGVVLGMALVGCADEYHQTFTPGRSGNDPLDLLADVLGAITGAFTFKRIHHRFK